MRIGGILSVYKGDSPIFLNQALKSIIRNQTKMFDECVGVIEGEIGQELENVCKSFSEIKWLNMIESDIFGLPMALNMAVENINAEIVLKIDTDDLYSSRRIESTYSAFKENPLLGIHGGQVSEFSNDWRINYGLRSVPCTNSEIIRLSKRRNPFNGPTVAFKKKLFIQYGGFPSVGANEDYCLWSSFLLHNVFASNSPEIYAFMRGGKDLIKRRSGLTYLRGEMEALKYIRSIGFFSRTQYWFHVLLKQSVRRMSLKWNSYIYSRLRNNVEPKIPKELEDIIQILQNEK